MNQTAALTESINSIKQELLAGAKAEVPALVTRDRQTGKSTALMEFVHEYCKGLCAIITCTSGMAQVTTRKYHELYPNDAKPLVLALTRLDNEVLMGRQLRGWATDEIWPSAAIRKAPVLEALTFLGGVGTPLCMDTHSDY
jgi:hypothetical protein